MEQAIIGAGGAADLDGVERFIARVENLAHRLPKGVVHVRDVSYIARAVGGRHDLLERVMAVTSQGDASDRRRWRTRGAAESPANEEELGSLRAGRIDKLPQLVRCGFIEDEEGKRWFVHYK